MDAQEVMTKQYPEGVVGTFQDKHIESAVAAGEQSFAITLSQGTERAIKKVEVYVQGAGADAYFKVARGTVISNTVIGEANYAAAYGKLEFDFKSGSNVLGTDGLVLIIDHDNVDAQTVHVNVEYLHN